MEQKIYLKNDAASVAAEIGALSPANVLVVTDMTFYASSGAKEFVEPLLQGASPHYFTGFDVNPKLEDLYKGVALCRENGIDLIVAVGGGSVIDMAKLIRSYAGYEGDISEAIKCNRIAAGKLIPMLAIPTTSGTGSESTHFAVVYIDKVKYSVADGNVLPDYVWLIPSLTYGCPRYLTASTGADALCQAIESYWSVKSTEESRGYAREAIDILWRHLPDAIAGVAEARDHMAYAANLAGKAINISFTTAAHAYSYGFTSYLGIPHGHAVSLTLPYFFELNLAVTPDTCNDPRGADFVRERLAEIATIIGCCAAETPHELTAFFESVFGKTDIWSKLDEATWSSILSSVNLQRMQNNPAAVESHIPKEIFRVG